MAHTILGIKQPDCNRKMVNPAFVNISPISSSLQSPMRGKVIGGQSNLISRKLPITAAHLITTTNPSSHLNRIFLFAELNPSLEQIPLPSQLLNFSQQRGSGAHCALQLGLDSQLCERCSL
uniref:Uncharacterized protein n=1 Tax=Opuntia streptacantha TaxID=393608 RepID=A0A7C9EQT0_OPUST